MSLSVRPGVVLCSNDMTVSGVLREACERTIIIPDDFSVVGFDYIRRGEFTIPHLTKVQMSQAKLSKMHKPEGA